MLTIENFRERFPEFKSVPLDMLTLVFAEADKELDPVGWGIQLDTAKAYLSAHKLCISPYGQQARLAAKDGETTYSKHFRELQIKTFAGMRVAGRIVRVSGV